MNFVKLLAKPTKSFYPFPVGSVSQPRWHECYPGVSLNDFKL